MDESKVPISAAAWSAKRVCRPVRLRVSTSIDGSPWSACYGLDFDLIASVTTNQS